LARPAVDFSTSDGRAVHQRQMMQRLFHKFAWRMALTPILAGATVLSALGSLRLAEAVLRRGTPWSAGWTLAIVMGGWIVVPAVLVCSARRGADRAGPAKVLLFYLAFVAACLAAETGLRWIEPPARGDRTYMSNHPVLGEALTPNYTYTRPGCTAVHHTDAEGIVVRPHLFADAPATIAASRPLQILMLGDSMIHGRETPAAENVSVYLEQTLHRRWNVAARVVNLGTTGWSPVNYLLAYRLYKDRLRPDVVMVCVYVHNDFFEDARRFLYGRILLAGDGNPQAVRPVFDPQSGTRWTTHAGLEHAPLQPPWNDLRILTRLHLKRLHDRLLNAFQEDLSRYNEIPQRQLTSPIWDYSQRNETLVRNNQFAIFKDCYTAEDREDISRSLSYLARLHDEVRADGRRMVLVAIPCFLQVANQGEEIKLQAGYGIRPGETTSNDAPQGILRDFAAGRHLAFCDPLPALREQSGRQLFLAADVHFTSAGQEVLATALGDCPLLHGVP
jgi:hypothetical protein